MELVLPVCVTASAYPFQQHETTRTRVENTPQVDDERHPHCSVVAVLCLCRGMGQQSSNEGYGWKQETRADDVGRGAQRATTPLDATMVQY